ncbi:DUF192 domain-containing protein [Helicovermis profundi]|uniref:DUF192 domain-containing protein n=1 Tax=Helicovermis profundi TaxID=3065157 RepID=A0AAU9EKI2_9FIRM|nr:hypothetical protein HLPR_00570 [Clostridia bacterium S502]
MKTIVLKNYYIASSFKDKLLGYMFRKKPHKEIIVFKGTSSVHTYFMKFNIDIVFLDENYKILAINKNIPHGKMIFSKKKTTYALEAIANGIFKDASIGDKIVFHN